MIVDLLRNDLGRIAVPGTVRWSKVFEAERYETVWQLTSTIDRATCGRRPACSTCSARCSRADRSPARRRCARCGSSRTSRTRPAASTAARSATSRRRRPAGRRRRTSTSRSGPWRRRRDRHRRVRRRRRHHVRLLGGRRVRGDAREGAGPHRQASAVRAVRDDAPRPRRGRSSGSSHLERLRSSAAYFGFAFDDGCGARGARTGRCRRRPLRQGPSPTEPSRRRSRSSSAVLDRGAPEPVRVALDDEPVDPSDVLAVPQDDPARAATRTRARGVPTWTTSLLVNTRGEVTETTIANLAVRLGGRWWTPPLDCRTARGNRACRAPGRRRDRGARRRRRGGSDRAEALALVNSVRGWRRAMLVDPGSLESRTQTSGAGSWAGNVNGCMRSSSIGQAQRGQHGGSS